MMLTTQSYDSPLGELLLAASESGLRAILWPNDNDERARVKLGPCEDGSNKILDQTKRELDEYFAGERRTFDVALDPKGTDFQNQVWASLSKIEYGTTQSYGDQAVAIERPTAVRAVASANGKNPISIVVPCHRVIGSNGSLTGFAGGLDAKRWLLQHELSHMWDD